MCVYRTDEKQTCFTGALCGLGSNPITHEAILPEQDTELAFDVKFDVDDIAEVVKCDLCFLNNFYIYNLESSTV